MSDTAASGLRATRVFDVTPKEAVRLQEMMRGKIETSSPLDLTRLRFVAGVDVSYLKGDDSMFAAAAVFSYPALEVVESRSGSAPVNFPYVPGLLAFREAPAIIAVLGGLKTEPDVLLVDGHGVAHPRGAGIASHLGVALGLPSIGVAKTVLVGDFSEPGPERGASSPLALEGRTVGLALRTRRGVKPVFVSVGHLADLESAAWLALSCCGRYRLPEPIREAHRLANLARVSNNAT